METLYNGLIKKKDTKASQLYVTPNRQRSRFPYVPNPWDLSGAEFEVARMTTLDIAPSLIASTLCIAPKTVSTHLERAKDKMKVGSRVGLALVFDRYYRDRQIVDPARLEYDKTKRLAERVLIEYTDVQADDHRYTFTVAQLVHFSRLLKEDPGLGVPCAKLE